MTGSRGLTPVRRTVMIVLALAGTGCGPGIQSALDPQGPSAEAVAWLWWVLLAVCLVVQVLVTAAVLMAVFRRNRQPVSVLLAHGEPVKRKVIAGATLATLLTLVGLVVASVMTDRVVSRLPGADQSPLEIVVVGHQWWWEVEYVDAMASRRFITANEVRVPVGRPVIVRLESRDVVHSFWVPNLAGKIDVVPGRRNTVWFQADTPGTYRGQCAEFCGLQHAKMAFVVVAETPERFEAWAETYRKPPAEPASELARMGEQVFLASQCALCHRVRGSDAWGRVAPDLSRIASRRTLAAGTLPNTRGNMAAWILDPQHIKPGSFMPPTALEPEHLHALLAYLEGLE